jgi:ribosomal protein L17
LEATLKKANWLERYESTVHLLDNFTRFVGRVTKTSKAEDFWTILDFSWCVASVAGLNKILEENQVRYLSKLGDYVRILKRIPLLLKKTGNTKITVEQVMT